MKPTVYLLNRRQLSGSLRRVGRLLRNTPPLVTLNNDYL